MSKRYDSEGYDKHTGLHKRTGKSREWMLEQEKIDRNMKKGVRKPPEKDDE